MENRLIILGSGAAPGVPSLGTGCGRCNPENPTNPEQPSNPMTPTDTNTQTDNVAMVTPQTGDDSTTVGIWASVMAVCAGGIAFITGRKIKSKVK